MFFSSIYLEVSLGGLKYQESVFEDDNHAHWASPVLSMYEISRYCGLAHVWTVVLIVSTENSTCASSSIEN